MQGILHLAMNIASMCLNVTVLIILKSGLAILAGAYGRSDQMQLKRIDYCTWMWYNFSFSDPVTPHHLAHSMGAGPPPFGNRCSRALPLIVEYEEDIDPQKR